MRRMTLRLNEDTQADGAIAVVSESHVTVWERDEHLFSTGQLTDEGSKGS